jgi:hypothetical protein
MPLYKLTQEMPYDEFIGWMQYFELRPVGWRDDDRTLKLLQVQGYKGKGSQVFPSLAALERGRNSSDPIDSLKGSIFFTKMREAKGGDKPDFLKEAL